MSTFGAFCGFARRFTKAAGDLLVQCTYNTALLVGLAVAPVVGVVGAAMDLSEAHMTEGRLTRAAAGAATALQARPDRPAPERNRLARIIVLERLGAEADRLALTVSDNDPASAVARVEIDALAPTLALRVTVAADGRAVPPARKRLAANR